MKKLIYLNFLSLIISLSMSCASKMVMEKTATPFVPESFLEKTEPDMEFIGFKADSNTLSTNAGDLVQYAGTWTAESYNFPSEFELWKTYKADTTLRTLGSVLQNTNVAYDQSFAYFGIYSLQELELYKSQKRYVTFIEVNKNKLTGTVSDPTTILGACTLGGGLGLAISGLIFMGGDPNNNVGFGDTGKAYTGIGLSASALGAILLAIPAKTKLEFTGVYQIYVYDTVEKKIIYKDSVSIKENDEFKGSYFNQETNKSAVHEYYGTLVYNALLQKYEEINKFLYGYDKALNN